MLNEVYQVFKIDRWIATIDNPIPYISALLIFFIEEVAYSNLYDLNSMPSSNISGTPRNIFCFFFLY